MLECQGSYVAVLADVCRYRAPQMVEGGCAAGKMQSSKIRRLSQHMATFFCNPRDKLYDSWRHASLMQSLKHVETIKV